MGDSFEDIVAGLDIKEPEDTFRVRDLSDLELTLKFREVKQLLRDTGEMLKDLKETGPSTPEGRELHSLRVACEVELSRRGLR